MKKLFGAFFKAVMNFVYLFFKLLPVKNKVSFISRQSETPSLDFRLMIECLEKEYPEYEVSVLCKMIPDSFSGKLLYCFEFLKQMKALATSRVVVLDGYCILACMLKHKKDLKIIQIWHALGAFKRFGKSILDLDGGSSSETAEAFDMHRNYDFVACSGNACVGPFSEAFGQKKSDFIPIGIPRMDFLTDKKENEKLKNKIYSEYPSLNNGRKNILYVPTFRDNDESRQQLREATRNLVNAVNYDEYNLIVKHHVVDSDKEQIYTDNASNEIEGESFVGMEFMSVADCVVTDYSSIIYEALLKNLPIYIYCFDSERYLDERGFYIDFYNDIPAVYSKTAKELIDKIERGEEADKEKIACFKKQYVNYDTNVAQKYASLIDMLIRNCYDGRYNYKPEGENG